MIDSSIHVDMLRELLNSDSLKILSNEKESVNKMDIILNNFINDKVNLVGKEWDNVRNKLGKYEEIYKRRMIVVNSLVTTINSVVSILLNYLGDDLYLDISKLDEMREAKRKVEISIVEMEDAINSKTIINYIKEDGSIGTKEEYLYNYEKRMEFQNNINLLRNDILPEINRLIDKIIGLEDVYNEVKLMMNNELSNVEKFALEVDSIIPSKKVSFQS